MTVGVVLVFPGAGFVFRGVFGKLDYSLSQYWLLYRQARASNLNPLLKPPACQAVPNDGAAYWRGQGRLLLYAAQ